MANFEEDDSNHSVNGWIKKEIEDDDFEDYIKQEQPDEYPSSERYEELMSLSKEDLVGRILQQEEDIRYLQDIRHGLEKNVEGFSTSCNNFKKLLEVMTSAVSSLKDAQHHVPLPGTTSSSSTPRSAGISTTTSRSTVSAPTSQASPRSTPTNVPPPSSPRLTSNLSSMPSNPRSSANTVSMPSNHMTNVCSGDRMHATASSMSSHQTVTITKQTNVIIKTEIPSPPPSEPMITSTPLMSSNIPPANMAQPAAKNRAESSAFYTRQQTPATHTTAGKMLTVSSRSITDIANSIPPNRQRARMNSMQQQNSNISSKPNTRTNIQQQQFQAQSQPQASQFISGRGGRGRASHPQRSTPYMTQRPVRQAAGNNPLIRPRATPAKANVMSPGSGDPPVNDLLANISFKVPSGITLSIIPPKQNTDSRTQPSHSDRSAAMSNIAKSGEAANRANMPHSLLVEEISTSKLSTDKGASSAGGTNTTYSVTNTMSSASGNFQVGEGDEEEDYFDEIAVLIPDKKSSPTVDATNQQGMPDGVPCNAIVSVDPHAKSQQNEYWNSQASGQKPGQTVYQNNAEYMFEEPDDFDSDENEAKVYLGENVTLPREIVDTCIKQGPTPTKLTRNLMKALFPDMRELAAGCPEGDASRPTQPSLPANKVKAIIALVQKTFPQVNRAGIVMAMNMRCKEAKTQLSKSNSQAYSTF